METYLRGNVWYARWRDANDEPKRTSLNVAKGAPNESALVQQAVADLLSKERPKDGRSSGGGMSLKAVYEQALRTHYADAKDLRGVESRWLDVSGFFDVDAPIASVTALKIAQYKAHLIAKGNSLKTVNRKVSLLTKLLHLAADWEVLDKIPVVKRYAEPEGRIRWPSYEEEATMTAWLRAGAGGGGRVGNRAEPEQPRAWCTDMADLVEALVDTGMRLAEALRAEDRDVAFTPTPKITVWVQKGKKPRTVPLTARAAAIFFARLRVERARDEREKGTSRPFGMLTQDSAGKLWSAGREAMGLAHDDQFVIHALRHGFAVRMIEAECDIRTLQVLMGHSSVKTTEKYAHVSGRAARGAIDKLERVRAAVPEVPTGLRVVARAAAGE